MFCQKNRDVESPHIDDLYEYGVFAKLVKVLEMPGPGNNVTAIIRGLGRCRMKSIGEEEPFLMGEVETCIEVMPDADDSEFKTAIDDLRSRR